MGKLSNTGRQRPPKFKTKLGQAHFTIPRNTLCLRFVSIDRTWEPHTTSKQLDFDRFVRRSNHDAPAKYYEFEDGGNLLRVLNKDICFKKRR